MPRSPVAGLRQAVDGIHRKVEAVKIDEHADFQLGQTLAQDGDGGEGLQRGQHVPASRP